MLAGKQSLSCDVYMAGHHGSANASSEKFLQAMKPKYTVISCGADNKYGHPAQGAMSRFKAIGTKIFRTDQQGTIIATSNGSSIKWNKSPSRLWSYREYGSSSLIAADGSKSQISGSKNTSGGTTAQGSAPALAKGQKYIGNINSKKFHLPSCRGLPYERTVCILRASRRHIRRDTLRADFVIRRAEVCTFDYLRGVCYHKIYMPFGVDKELRKGVQNLWTE